MVCYILICGFFRLVVSPEEGSRCFRNSCLFEVLVKVAKFIVNVVDITHVQPLSKIYMLCPGLL